MQYEQILNKISPIFFKFIRFNIDIGKLDTISYLNVQKIPNSARKFIIAECIKSINYVYHCIWYSKYSYPVYMNVNFNLTYESKVSLTAKYEIEEIDSYGLDDFIVNTVLNKFCFENEKIVSYGGYVKLNKTYKDLFIALVGKDTYEAIRRNIR